MGQLPGSGVYQIAVAFDQSMKRYYQGVLQNKDKGELSFLERVPFRLDGTDSLSKKLKLITDSVKRELSLVRN